MAEKSPLLPVALPRSTGEIVVRQFRPEDAPQVHALLVGSLVHGPDSPRNIALWRNLTNSISCIAYAGLALGLGCLSRRNETFQICGIVFSLGSVLFFIYVRQSITKMFVNFCATALKTDMADIMASYEIPRPGAGTQIPADQGPGGFWVAVIESPDHKTSEVVGYLGLGASFHYRANADPSSGELRRMIVSMHHRRRKIGTLLIASVMDHARKLSPPLETLDLETSEYQPGARKLYEKHGFSIVGSRVMRSGPLFSMKVFRFRRRVAD
ncbi:acyl-CoA N-acyltransferase [Mycena maculata]|uniref:Acyl-CoA N-acyltransferase n=1 Tax=Mycena maculata TaxID=230809 RepID=A0AAD7NMR5_9AGAR|nr:acyl-CoA N-acyltransferase [Mycena maculata]